MTWGGVEPWASVSISMGWWYGKRNPPEIPNAEAMRRGLMQLAEIVGDRPFRFRVRESGRYGTYTELRMEAWWPLEP